MKLDFFSARDELLGATARLPKAGKLLSRIE